MNSILEHYGSWSQFLTVIMAVLFPLLWFCANKKNRTILYVAVLTVVFALIIHYLLSVIFVVSSGNFDGHTYILTDKQSDFGDPSYFATAFFATGFLFIYDKHFEMTGRILIILAFITALFKILFDGSSLLDIVFSCYVALFSSNLFLINKAKIVDLLDNHKNS